MTTQYYFDYFLQVGDKIRFVNDEKEQLLYKEGIVKAIDYENSMISLEIEGITYTEVSLQDFEPVEYREISRLEIEDKNKENKNK